MMLDVNHVYKTFHPGTINERRALAGVDLHLEEGDFVTVIGGNGAGKSTLLNAVAGVLPVDGGSIVIDGNDITGLPDYKRAPFIGRVFQDPMMGTAPDMQLEENLALAYRRGKKLGLRWHINREERDMYRERLRELNLGLEDRLTTKVGLLSGGQRQAVTLLMATINTPRVLLLDEHTAALDPVVAERVLHITQDIVAENHITTMMVTHNIGAALSLGTRTIMLERGRIVLDLSGETRDKLDVPGLLALYREACGAELDNDRMLLSH